jgi:hypothetical protein
VQRNLPALGTKFRIQTGVALDLIGMSRQLRLDAIVGPRVRMHLTARRESLLYELAYLRVFSAWEIFLEDLFLRYLCGYRFGGVAETPLVAFAPNLVAARQALYGNQAYLLWHNPQKAIARANNHFVGGNRIATVVGSALTDISNYAAVRHRIAHDHSDARTKFDAATMQLMARHFPGARAGLFLRAQTTHVGNPMSWLERIALELDSLASQLAP